MEAYLTESIKKIKDQFRSLINAVHIPDGKSFNSLEESSKSNFVKKYEEFWHIIITLKDLVDEMSDVLSCINELDLDIKLKKQTRDVVMLEYEDMEKWMKEIPILTRSFFSAIYTLCKLLKGEGWLLGPDLEKYQEIWYLYLIRNDFLVHPRFGYPFSKLGNIILTKDDERLLSFSSLAPTFGGLSFLTAFYTEKSFGNLEKLPSSVERLQEENKNDFLKVGGWKKLSDTNYLLRCRIGSLGLPQINQESLSKDLEALFENVIFPKINLLKEQAKKDGVYLD